MALTPTAFTASPITFDDVLIFPENTTALSGAGTILTLDVRANDPGAGPIWSIASTGTFSALQTADAPSTWEPTAGGNRIRIVDGKVEVDLATALTRYSGTIDALRAGDRITDSFFYTVQLADGSLSLAKATFTINGTNDAPVITSTAATVALTEDGATLSASGTITATDIDFGTLLTFSGNRSDAFGTFTVLQGGAWTYTIKPTSAAVQGLAQGEVKTLTYPVTVSDGAGGTATQNVTVTLTGTNDVPVITRATLTGRLTEDATVSTASGTITATDADAGTTLAYSATAITEDADSYGTMTVNAAGRWTFTLAPTAAEVQGLGRGETKVLNYNINVSDGAGGSVDRTVTITLTGTNDAPVITAADSARSIAEGAANPVLTGQITATDADGDTLTYTATPLVRADAANFGNLTVNTSGQWTFTLANTAAVRALTEGQVKTVDFNVTVRDGNGGSAVQKVTITINGTNSVPVVTDALSTFAGTLTEDLRGGSVAKGAIIARDADASAVLTYTATPVTAQASDYGTFTVDSTGRWTFTLNNASAKVQELKTGETKTLVYDVAVKDALNATVTKQVTLSVKGADDVAVFANTTPKPVVTEDATLTASGTLTVTDRDAGQTGFATPATLAGTYGAFTFDTATGAWAYALNNAAANVQTLTSADSRIDTLVVKSLDGTSYALNVTIKGANEPTPALAATVTTADPTDTDTATATGPAGTASADVLLGTASADSLTALAGDDTVHGRGGSDLVSGGADGDFLYGGTGSDTLFGEDGNDALFGGSGSDLLAGGAGADTLTGGHGADTLIGGDGADVFLFVSVSDRGDVIQDFNAATDKIDLSDIDAGFPMVAQAFSGPQAFAATQAFAWGGTTATANGVWYVNGANGVTTFYGDTDGDTTTAEFWFRVNTTTFDQTNVLLS